MKNRIINIFVILVVSLIIKFINVIYLDQNFSYLIRIIDAIFILVVGAGIVLKKAADIIEETTDVLSKKTNLAGGFLQSFGTAFPDMALGIVAAVISLRVSKSNYPLAISYAVIAAATTFGSNIYNIAHAAWCVFRQNLSDKRSENILMFPLVKKMGIVRPLITHLKKPQIVEIDTAIDILNALTLLTAIVAISMVVFGRVKNVPVGINGDLYQLIKPVGIMLFVLSTYVMYHFRKTKRSENPLEEIVEEENYFMRQPVIFVWISLILSGAAILFAAESMVDAIRVICDISGLAYVVAGTFAGVIGCLGEMIVVHNYTVHPKGRIADALVGVAMDNIVTTIGASVVAIMGGIFLGGNALIVIFVIILTLNTVLIWQISKMKNTLAILGNK